MPQLAIVGSRHPSHSGLADARDFAADLSRAGLVITSGLASGIDGAAHTGALRAGGRTIAVLGTGADRPYPREHQRLYGEIRASSGGLIVSEYPAGHAAAGAITFRDAIASSADLSLGVLVVEAAPESGSLITARLAAEHGRPVWALPGSRHHAQARGCLQLIREGASLVTETAHILEDLPALVGWLREQLPLPVSAASDGRGGRRKTASGRAGVRTPPLLDSCWRCWGRSAAMPTGSLPCRGLAPAATFCKGLVRSWKCPGLVASVPGGYERLPAGAGASLSGRLRSGAAGAVQK
jgi:DNA protecting protein DprA